jgi:rRNA maturation endonuclease Nob1
MTPNLAIVVGGVVALMIISVMIGTTLETTAQQRAARQAADERLLLVREQENLAREQGMTLRARRERAWARRCTKCGRPFPPTA